ncbi:antitoxin Xre/MbcA/ParS toxin-binding domain-containing protein [Acinetobacter variabilis]|uniref:antitoxin Xre/MbcA/ParS toxin-binding domain-containing protein n=1 Tax=Acinetobacter variabilis TaxID=70346 RepID=UPI002FD947A8
MDRSVILAKAVLKTGAILGIELDQLARVLGVDYTTILQLTALNPDSKQGEHAIILIRIFRLLYELNGGDMQWIRLYMNSPNHSTGGIPLQQIQQEIGLIKVLESLERISPK